MDKWNMVQLYNGIFGHVKEWSPHLYYNIDEPWKHYTKWKQSVTMYKISSTRNDQNRQSHSDRK